jgi:D-alanyl-D-alanine carboxypeptidase (penicillin-binding protein 5/6)
LHNESDRRPARPDYASKRFRRSSGRRGGPARILALAIVVGLLAGAAVFSLSVEPFLSAVSKTVAAASPRHAPGSAARAPAQDKLAFSTTWVSGHPGPAIDVHGQAAVLVDVETKQVLWQRDARSRKAPASLAKLVTAMVAADLAPLDRSVTVSGSTDMAAVQRVEPTSTVMGLTAGEVLTVRELLYGLFLRSGNDAAETLGGGIVSRGRFISLMNKKAASLGMTGSHFTTPVGLDDSRMRTTAYDLAVAAAAVVTRYPELLKISGTPSAQIPQTGTHKAFAMQNFNRLVLSGTTAYPGATGMKTAFTDDAGPCMVATANRNGRRLIAVVLHSDSFFTDATRLLDYGYSLKL